MLLSLQYARAVASLLVVYAHLSGFHLFRTVQTKEFGAFGVDIFFVISGFIMWQSARSQSPSDFARKRLIRIVPAYWFYTILLSAISLLIPALAKNIDANLSAILHSLFFLPYFNQKGQLNPILLQGWTLNYEAYYYFIFFLWSFPLVRHWKLIGVVSSLAAVSLIVRVSVGEDSALAFYGGSVVYEFALGMLLSEIQGWLKKLPMWASLGLVLTSFLVILVVSTVPTETIDSIPRVLYYGIPSSLFLAGWLNFESFFKSHEFRFARMIGDASYSLYLCHPFVLSAVARILDESSAIKHLPASTGALLFIFIAGITSIIAAFASYRYIEQPSVRLLNRGLSFRKGHPAGEAIQRLKSSRSK